SSCPELCTSSPREVSALHSRLLGLHNEGRHSDRMDRSAGLSRSRADVWLSLWSNVSRRDGFRTPAPVRLRAWRLAPGLAWRAWPARMARRGVLGRPRRRARLRWAGPRSPNAAVGLRAARDLPSAGDC